MSSARGLRTSNAKARICEFEAPEKCRSDRDSANYSVGRPQQQRKEYVSSRVAAASSINHDANQLTYLTRLGAGNFIGFAKPLQRQSALLGEKWIRALTYSGTVALVAGKREGIIGMLAIDRSVKIEPNIPVLHESLSYLSSFLVPGVALITATSVGDLYVQFSGGATFVKRQGRWHYLNTKMLLEKIAAHLPKAHAAGVASMALALSYERKGALFGIIDEADVANVTPDHGNKKRPNASLRTIARQLQLSNAAHQTILRSAAAIDGAVLVSTHGDVLDVACMIQSPTPEELTRKGCILHGSLPGARSTAARNCSVYGIAIKVSDDGPISVFENGNASLELG